MLSKRALLCGLIAAGMGMAAIAPAEAQTYPTRVVRIVVPFPPGGPTDIIARILANHLQGQFGQPVIVESRPGGAGGTVGARSVATSEPDGYTLLFALTGTLSIAPTIFKGSGYDPLKNFAPVAMVASGAQVLTVHPSLPVSSIKDLVAYAKSNPGKVSYASPGFGTQPHLLGELFKSVTGTDIVHVPYKGSAPAVTDLVAGQVQMMFDTPTTLGPHIDAGKLRPLAVTTGKRTPRLPQVPTIAEAGFGQLEATLWGGVVAPAGTPPEIVATLNKAINAGLKTEEMRASLAKFALEPDVRSPQEFGALLASEVKRWAEVVEAAGIKVK
jgi:tripartite-type tricarboxylate transporter receptor subunit TctC